MGYGFMPYFDDEAIEIQKQNKDFPSICRECEHITCVPNRELRKSKCAICDEEFKAGDKFYINKENKAEHALCVWKQEEARSKNANP